MAISKDIINKIMAAADIVDVISDYVKLKKSGRNFSAPCVFHNEKTASFVVSPEKGIYKCFGCGQGGGVVNFIMDHEGLSYPEALRLLADKYTIDIPERKLSEEEIYLQNKRENAFIANQYAAQEFFKYLQVAHHVDEVGGTNSFLYLKERGVSQAIIDKFFVGYALDDFSALLLAMKSKGYDLDNLKEVGLLRKNEKGNYYDYFRDRIIFPIQDISGNIVGFGGRALGDAKPKYLNSPETAVYDKSKVLYGLFQSKRAMMATSRCYLVEGYFDVTTMHQYGIENVVAASGTAISKWQVQVLKRFVAEVVLIFDADKAGEKATAKSMEVVIQEGLEVKVLTLPDGHDPDSFLRENSAAEFKSLEQDNLQDFIQYKIIQFGEKAERDISQKAKLLEEVIKLIYMVPSAIRRGLYITEISKIFNVDEYAIVQQMYRSK